MTMNRPLPSGSGFKEIGPCFREEFTETMKKFKPELILVSAGFDSRVGDPLGHFTLTDTQFIELTKILLDIANEHCEGRLISMLEGGYNVDGLASAVKGHLAQLIKA